MIRGTDWYSDTLDFLISSSQKEAAQTRIYSASAGTIYSESAVITVSNLRVFVFA